MRTDYKTILYSGHTLQKEALNSKILNRNENHKKLTLCPKNSMYCTDNLNITRYICVSHSNRASSALLPSCILDTASLGETVTSVWGTMSSRGSNAACRMCEQNTLAMTRTAGPMYEVSDDPEERRKATRQSIAENEAWWPVA